jgi:hypothetical protein
MKLELVLVIAVVVILGVVIEVVRRRRLSESYALLWIGVAVVGSLLALARPLVDHLSNAIGIVYGTSLVFALAILFLLIVCINLSMHVSRLEQRVETLAQELALRDVQGGEPAPLRGEATGTGTGTAGSAVDAGSAPDAAASGEDPGTLS